MIRVLVIDCDEKLYSGLQLVKQSEVELIGLVTDKKHILKEITRLKPSVILLCTSLEKNVSTLVGKLKQSTDDMKVIYVLDSYDEELVVDGLENNVEGYLLLQHEPEKLLTEIVNVSKGQFVLSGEIARKLINEIRTRHLYKKQLLKSRLIDQGYDIKDRYVDIIFLILQRYKNLEIATKLNLSEKTIRDYVSNIYNLVGIHNRKKLIAFLEEMMRD